MLESQISLRLAFKIDGRINLSNVLPINLKSLPKVTSLDPLYTPCNTEDNEITIYGANLEQDFTFLIIDNFWQVPLQVSSKEKASFKAPMSHIPGLKTVQIGTSLSETISDAFLSI